MKIYAASSWRNPIHPAVVHILRKCGHEVFDYRHPEPGNNGFKWDQCGISYKHGDRVTYEQYMDMLNNPVAKHAFDLDFRGLDSADACVLTLESGKSSHLELGYAIGKGKLSVIILPPDIEPDLMYKMATHIIDGPAGLFDIFGEPRE